MSFGGFYEDDQHHLMQAARAGQASSFHETYRCYSAAMMQSRAERPELLYGGKIVIPQSALHKLSNLHLSWPLLFKLTNNAQDRSTHSGVLEFTAEEGRVYLPQWMMQTLLLQEGQFVDIKNAELPLGAFVKIQPQHVEFLEITDPKAVLEQALRNFSTLTVGDILSFKYNDKLYDILVLETKPAGQGISIIETDLEVDFAPPVGYVEPTPQYKPTALSGARTDVLKGSTTSIEKHTVAEDIGFKPFAGSGQRLNGKSRGDAENAKSLSDNSNIPAALRLPPGKLFFGYPVVPVKKTGENGDTESSDTPKHLFTGAGQTLKAARKGAAGSPSTSSKK
ncbi:ubiquitin fusion degradation protein [Geranomyces variabilis]|nr:ubiquitin fusion degradation protein [Geranomyces variabilis]